MHSKHISRGWNTKNGRRRPTSYRPLVEALEDRITPSDLVVPLDPVLDQFGDQFEVVEVYRNEDGLGDRVTFGIFDTGASPVTFGWADQLFFDLVGQAIPVLPGVDVTASGVGGDLTGLVSQPGTILADGMHAVDLVALLDGQDSIDFSAAAAVANVQAMVGTETGSPDLPAIVGTPILNGGLSGSLSGGVAALIDMQGYQIDFGALFPEVPEYQGLVLPMPDLSFVAPGTLLTQDVETTEPVRVPVNFVGIDNHLDPGTTITESYNPVVQGIQATRTVNDVTFAVHDQTFLFDTGAQLSIISTAVAQALGLDLNNPETTIDIQGAGGSETVPGYTISQLTLPRDDNNDGVIDGTLTFTDVPVFVLDIDPSIDGILGMNLLNTASKALYDPNDPDGAGPAGPSLRFTFSTAPRDLGGDGDVIGLLNTLFPMFAGSVGGQSLPGFDTNPSSNNQPPTVAVDHAAVSVSEGQMAQNTGTFGDADGDAVQISADVGTVTQANGVWSWSLATTDGPLGPITVTITASDGQGGVANTTFTYTVANVAPTIAISGATNVNEGASYTLTLGAVTDPGADTITSYIVHWGDGTSDTYTAAGAKTHTYADGPGSNAITVDLQDEDGTFTDRANALSVTVDNVEPTIAIIGASNVNEGSSYTLTLGAVTDPGTDTVTSYIVHWGDGTTNTYTSAGAKSHTYADGPSNNAITVDLQDEDGAYADQANALSVAVDNVAPTIAISGASSVNEGAIYTLTLGAVTDPGTDTITAYIVHWGDGTSDTYTSTGAHTHTYLDGPGSLAITVDLQDEDGTFTDQANALSVTVDNVDPTIAISGASEINEGASYTLTLGATTDPGTDTVTDYIVHWGDGTSDTYTSTGAETHTYADGTAIYTVTVDLQDEDGTYLDQANALSVTVDNVEPTITINGTSEINEGASYTLTLGTTTDPGTDTVTDYIVHWGDGTTDTYTSAGAETHTYADGTANYTITVDLQDEEGTYFDQANALTVAVDDVAPTITITGAAGVNEGAGYTITLGAATDPGTDTVTDYIVHWGDGTTDTYTSAGAETHTYADGSGSYTITVDLQDEEGTYLDQANALTVAVDDVAPTIVITGVSRVNEGGIYTITLGAVTDPGADVISSYTVHWGDGTSDTYTSAGAESHTYTGGPGNYTITVDLQDEEGTYLDRANALTVAVDDVAPTIVISGAAHVNEGASYTLTLGPATDPGGDPVTSYIVHWGDGASDTYTSVGAKTHIYADGPASRAITVDLQDGVGTFTDQANAFSVAIDDVAPSIALEGNAQVNKLAPYTLQLGAVADPGVDTVTGYRVNWGDGSSTGFVAGAPTGQAIQHVYAQGGVNRVITVDLYDEDAAPHAAAGTKTVAVRNAAPNLIVKQKGTPTTVARGKVVSFAITLTNLGNSVATGVFTAMQLPAGMTFIAGSSTLGWQSIGVRRFRLNVGALEPGQAIKVIFKARIARSVAPGRALLTTATVGDDGLNGPDAVLANNTIRLVTRVS